MRILILISMSLTKRRESKIPIHHSSVLPMISLQHRISSPSFMGRPISSMEESSIHMFSHKVKTKSTPEKTSILSLRRPMPFIASEMKLILDSSLLKMMMTKKNRQSVPPLSTKTRESLSIKRQKKMRPLFFIESVI